MIKAGIVASEPQVIRISKIVKKLSMISCTAVYHPQRATGKLLSLDRSVSFTDYTDFLSEVDAVIFGNSCSSVCFAMVETALKQSKHVYMTDPLNLNVNEAQKLMKLNDEIPSILHIGNLSDIQMYANWLRSGNTRWINIRRTISTHDDFEYVIKHCISQSNHLHRGELKKVDAFQLSFDKNQHETGELRMEFFNGLVMNVQLVPNFWNEEYTTELFWNDNYLKFDFTDKKLYSSSFGNNLTTAIPDIITYNGRIEKELYEFESTILKPLLDKENVIENRLHPIFLYQFIFEKIKRTSITC